MDHKGGTIIDTSSIYSPGPEDNHGFLYVVGTARVIPRYFICV